MAATTAYLQWCDQNARRTFPVPEALRADASSKEAFSFNEPLETIEPKNASTYDGLYLEWKSYLIKQMEQ